MLSEKTLAQLRTLRYRPDAFRNVCILPLASIFWDDELPDAHEIEFTEQDWTEVWRAFAIRFRLWDHQPLADDDREFWESIRSAAPAWPIFCRLELSEDDRRAREEAERDCKEEIEGLLALADETTVSEETYGTSVTFRMKAAKLIQPSWWERLQQATNRLVRQWRR